MTTSGVQGLPERQAVPSARASRRRPSTREYQVFALATAVIVLHILVDAFVALAAGVSRTDHLASGLVPAAVAVLAMALYTRMRAGLRASVALVFGGLSLVGAGIAVVDAADGGPTGDDWTGFLLAPAGLVLCALGSRLLWITRRDDGRRYLRRTLMALGAVIAIYWLVVPLAIALVATHKPAATVERADLGRPYEEVTLRTVDGLDLRGWYVPSENGAAVIAFPGRRAPVQHARMLAANGYGVLLLDMRGQGQSAGDPNAYGWGSAQDLDAAVAYLQSRPDVRDGRIGGLGLSVGGELMIETAPANAGLRAVVSEGAGWRSLNESLARSGVPRAQVWLQYPHDVVQTAAVAVLGGVGPPSSLEERAADIAPRPLFLIYGEQGQGMEKALTPTYYDAAGQPKTLWEVAGADHTGGIDAAPGEYESRVIGFFDRALLDQ